MRGRCELGQLALRGFGQAAHNSTTVAAGIIVLKIGTMEESYWKYAAATGKILKPFGGFCMTGFRWLRQHSHTR